PRPPNGYYSYLRRASAVPQHQGVLELEELGRLPGPYVDGQIEAELGEQRRRRGRVGEDAERTVGARRRRRRAGGRDQVVGPSDSAARATRRAGDAIEGIAVRGDVPRAPGDGACGLTAARRAVARQRARKRLRQRLA